MKRRITVSASSPSGMVKISGSLLLTTEPQVTQQMRDDMRRSLKDQLLLAMPAAIGSIRVSDVKVT